MNTEVIASTANTVLVNVAVAILSLAGAYAVYYIRLGAAKLKEQTAQLRDEAARKTLENALDDVERLAEKAVSSMEQTTAKALREEVKAGKCDREQLLALGRKVFDEVKREVAPEAQRVILDSLGSFDRYLEQCIEDAVLKIKQGAPAQ